MLINNKSFCFSRNLVQRGGGRADKDRDRNDVEPGQGHGQRHFLGRRQPKDGREARSTTMQNKMVLDIDTADMGATERL